MKSSVKVFSNSAISLSDKSGLPIFDQKHLESELTRNALDLGLSFFSLAASWESADWIGTFLLHWKHVGKESEKQHT